MNVVWPQSTPYIYLVLGMCKKKTTQFYFLILLYAKTDAPAIFDPAKVAIFNFRSLKWIEMINKLEI